MNNFMQSLLLWQSPAPVAQPTGSAGWGITLIFWALAIGAMWWFMIRPQAQARRKQQDFAQGLKRGKKVVSIGGIHGTIVDIHDTYVVLMIAPKITIHLQRDCISMEMTNAVNGKPAETAKNEQPANPAKEESVDTASEQR